MRKNTVGIISWLLAIWMCKVFLSSLPYKFSGHPDTQHIFGTIGGWLSGFLGESLGGLFSQFGAIGVGGFELLTSIVLLLPLVLWLLSKMNLMTDSPRRAKFHRIGGVMATAVMAGAVFFHLFSPLGIEVLHQGKSDGGSLFYAAVSIMVAGIIMFGINTPKVERILSGSRY